MKTSRARKLRRIATVLLIVDVLVVTKPWDLGREVRPVIPKMRIVAIPDGSIDLIHYYTGGDPVLDVLRQQQFGELWLTHGERNRGVWARTSRHTRLELRFTPDRARPQLATLPAELTNLRRDFLSKARQMPYINRRYAPADAELAALINTGTAVRREVLWLGLLVNTVTLALVGAIVFTSRVIWLEKRAQRRINRGVCPGCAYEVSGLESGICPECGTRIPTDVPH